MDEYKEINLKSLFVCIYRKVWIVVITVLVFGISSFLITKYVLLPEYQATIRLYVNNKTEATDSLTSSDVSASQSLVDTYIAIIQSDVVLDDIVRSAGYQYTVDEIKDMMGARAVNGTEVFDVSITGTSPRGCVRIANLIAALAPDKISKIVDGSSVKVIDGAKMPEKPISPNTVKNVVVSFVLGFVLSCVAVISAYLLDTSIYTEDDIKEFCELPVLGIIPHLNQVSHREYGNSYVRRYENEGEA